MRVNFLLLLEFGDIDDVLSSNGVGRDYGDGWMRGCSGEECIFRSEDLIGCGESVW